MKQKVQLFDPGSQIFLHFYHNILASSSFARKSSLVKYFDEIAFTPQNEVDLWLETCGTKRNFCEHYRRGVFI